MFIRVYLFVCHHYRDGGLHAVVQRQSNNAKPDFTDEEVLTIYLFGLLRKRDEIKEIHEYAADHFATWFPDLPSHAGYVQRLNRLSAVFAPLTEAAIAEVSSDELIRILRIADSFPIMMAKEKRSSQATVAPELADKAYVDASLRERLCEEQNLTLLTPVKKTKGQPSLSAADKLLSEAVSRVRQPIESLFNWIDEKTGIQTASKVRSSDGLLVHAFGRLAAAMLLLSFNP